jgi:regulator of replication initiation timing
VIELPPLVLRLRQRIDDLADQRDELRVELKRTRRRLSEQRVRAENWKRRALRR